MYVCASIPTLCFYVLSLPKLPSLHPKQSVCYLPSVLPELTICLSLSGEDEKQTEEKDLEETAAAAAEEKKKTNDDVDNEDNDNSISKSETEGNGWKCDRCLNSCGPDQTLCLVCQAQNETNTDGKWQTPSVVVELLD